MALPTANLTYHGDCSVNTDLWKTNSAGTYSNHPADGEGVKYVEDKEHTKDVAMATWNTDPLWRSSAPLMLLPCIDFNGTSDYVTLMNDAGTVQTQASALVSASAFTILAAVYVEGSASNAAGNYDNEAIWNGGSNIGVHVKNVSGVYSIVCYNFDGNEDIVALPINLNTAYVLMYRHESGVIYGSLNGGSESSAASGNTGTLASACFIGANYSGAAFYNGRLGEIAFWNAALAGSNLTDAMSYFTSKWLPSGGATVTFVPQLGYHRPYPFSPGSPNISRF